MTSAPQHCPSPRELDDLQLLLTGALGDAPAFGGPGDAVRLQVPAEVAHAAAAVGAVELVDPEGLPLARVSLEATYESGGELVGVRGPVTGLAHHEYGAFRRLYRAPAGVRASMPADSLAVVVTSPLTERDLDLVDDKAAGRPVVLLALSGHGTPTHASRPMSATGLIRATLAAADLLAARGVDAEVVAVPLASRGPVGATPDGATPDADADADANANANADAELIAQVTAAYTPGEVLTVTGQGQLPAQVATIVEQELPARDRQGLVLFFTGLSGSGKSTLARALHDVILERGDRTVTSLDGDVVRRNLSAGLTFSRADRETNIRRIGWVAAEISRHRGVALCSPIAPFDATRQQVRSYVEEAGGAFFLVHVATPLEECERRDRKGLYAKARRGEIPEFTGISSPYEPPENADLRVDTTGRGIDDVLADILTALDSAGYVPTLPEDPT